MGGIIALSLALVNISFRLCPVFPFSMNTVFIWWSIVVMGGVIAAILIYIFEYWSVKRGYIAWTALVEKDIKVNTQSWKQLWWVMLLCLAVLILCLAAGVALNNLMS
jgi:phosphate/sulfate permease